MEYKKSNIIIRSKYKSTILENKVLAMAFCNIQNSLINEDDDIVVNISASQIKEALGKGNNIYTTLKSVARGLIGRYIGFEDDENKTFHYISLISETEYKNGTMTIVFNKKLNEKLCQLQNRYTLLSLPIMMEINSVYSFRLYELLKSEAFIDNKRCQSSADGNFEFYIGVSELKFELGVVDASEKKIQDFLSGKKNPDYDKAVELASKKIYSNWRDFKKSVIETSVKEINEKTDIELSYKTKRSGRGGKISGIIFDFKIRKEVIKIDGTKKELTEQEKFALLDKVMKLIKENISVIEAAKILEIANYNFDVIYNQYYNSRKAKNIDNIVGWLIDAIKNNYQSSTNNNDLYNTFEENDYDFDELEQALVRN